KSPKSFARPCCIATAEATDWMLFRSCPITFTRYLPRFSLKQPPGSSRNEAWRLDGKRTGGALDEDRKPRGTSGATRKLTVCAIPKRKLTVCSTPERKLTVCSTREATRPCSRPSCNL